MITTLLEAVFAVDIPPVEPDFSAPFITGLHRFASWALAGGLVVLLICAVLAAIALGVKSTPDRMRSIAENWFFRIIIALLVLGSLNGLFAFFFNYDFGF